MLRSMRMAAMAIVLMLPLFFLISSVSAEGSSSSSSAKSEGQSSSCSLTPQQVSEKASACKAQGMEPVVKYDGKCYQYLDCVERPATKQETEKPRTVEEPRPPVSCPMTVQQVAEVISKCQQQGMKPDIKKDGMCYSATCMPKSAETNAVSSSPVTKVVTCKKIMAAGCQIISCEDGFQFNSCAMGEMCKKLANTAGQSSASFSSKPAMPMPPMPMGGPCSEQEKAFKDLVIKLQQGPSGSDAGRKISDLSQKLTECRKNSIGMKMSSSSSTSSK